MTPPRDFTPDELLSALEHNRMPGESDPLLRLGRALADAAPAVEPPDPDFTSHLRAKLMATPPAAPLVKGEPRGIPFSLSVLLPLVGVVAIATIVFFLPRTTTSPHPTVEVARTPATGTDQSTTSPTPDTLPPTPSPAAASAPAAPGTSTSQTPPTPSAVSEQKPELPQGDLVLAVRQEKDGPLLTWTPRTTDGFLSYELLRSTTNPEPALADTKPFATLVKRDTTTFLDAAAAKKTTYFYRVCSTERDGETWCGNVVKFTTP